MSHRIIRITCLLLLGPVCQIGIADPICHQRQIVVVPQHQAVQLLQVPVDSYALGVQSFLPQYYYSVADAYQQKALIREVMREELRNFANGQQAPATPNYQPSTPAPQPVPGAQPGTNSNVPPEAQYLKDKPGQKEKVDVTTPKELQDKVLAAFNGRANCVSCHSGPAAAKGFRLVDDQGRLLDLSSDKAWKVYGMATTGVMPIAARTDSNKAMELTHLPALLQWANTK